MGMRTVIGVIIPEPDCKTVGCGGEERTTSIAFHFLVSTDAVRSSPRPTEVQLCQIPI